MRGGVPPHGFDAINELARSLGVRVAFHGHHHDQPDYSAHRECLDFAAYGVGFRGIVDQDDCMIRAGELDELRQYRQEGIEGAGGDVDHTGHL